MTSPFTIAFTTLAAVLLLALACAPPFFPSEAPLDPVPVLPAPPNIEATVEAMVEKRVRQALDAIPTVTPPPTATPFPTATPQPAPDMHRLPEAQSEVTVAASGPPEEPTSVPSPAPAVAPSAAGLADMVNRVKSGVVRVNTPGGVGSGIIFERAKGGKGMVLTNYHVVEDSYRIDVLVDDSRTFRANVVGFDQRRDLAVLEICCDQFPILELNTTAGISAGSEVVAIGYALGLTGNATVTRGIVSAVRYHPGMRAWVIQTDASINPGNSGGPLLLPTGEVIGITTFLQNQDNRGNPTAGLGFAISGRTIRGLLPDLKGGASNIVTPANPGDGNARPAQPMRWQTYTNDTHHYSVDVPEGWGQRRQRPGPGPPRQCGRVRRPDHDCLRRSGGQGGGLGGRRGGPAPGFLREPLPVDAAGNPGQQRRERGCAYSFSRPGLRELLPAAGYRAFPEDCSGQFCGILPHLRTLLFQVFGRPAGGAIQHSYPLSGRPFQPQSGSYWAVLKKPVMP